MTDNEIANNIYFKIIKKMKIKKINLTKLSDITGIPDSTLSAQLKKLKDGKFIPIKSIREFEKKLEIELIFFDK